MNVLPITAAACAALALASAALAGPACVEPLNQDAGRLPSTAFMPLGAAGTPLFSIQGHLDVNDPTDLEDMYQIHIDDPVNFSAKTTFLRGGSATFDTVLWLFDMNGFALLANDDRTVLNGGSIINSPATDATGQVIPAAGCYFLAISGAGDMPLSAGGPMFSFANPFEISGPDGIGGGLPIIAWTGGGPQGEYLIILTGASICPSPAAAAPLLAFGALFRRRRT